MPRAARRLIAAALASVAVITALTGCASGSGTGAAAGPAASAKPVTVATMYGDVTVPAHPKRIAALDFPEATALADLGIKPVGISSYIPALPAYTEFFKGVPNDLTDDSGIPVPEKVAALKPDLIIMDDFEENLEKDRPVYEKLQQIAPTIVLRWTQAAGSWQEDAEGTAEAVGKSAELDKLKADFETHAADIKKQYADVLASHTVDLVSGDASNWFLYSDVSSHGRVLAAAGARFGAAAGQKDGFVQYSLEKYGILDKTGIIMVAGTGGADKPVRDNPVFAALPAAKAGDVFATDYYFPSSYRIANALLDDFAAALKQVK